MLEIERVQQAVGSRLLAFKAWPEVVPPHADLRGAAERG